MAESDVNNSDGTSDKHVVTSREKKESPLTLKYRIKFFLSAHWRGVVYTVTPLVLIFILYPFPPESYQWCAYCLVIMAVFWVTECIPLVVTAFLPIFIFPMTNVMDTVTTCNSYMNDTVIMFIGGLMLAYSVEQSGLHKRIALCSIRTIGYSHKKLLFAMSFTTMFLSMWISNIAATTMMMPINFAILKTFENLGVLKIYDTNSNGDKIASGITTCYFCIASFSATIGGIGTLVGTSTNLIFKGLFRTAYPNAPEYLSFPKFSAFAVPYMLVLNILTYLYMLIVYLGMFRPNSEAAKKSHIPPNGIEAAKMVVDKDYKKLGALTFWEAMVLILFSIAIILFFCSAPEIFKGWSDYLLDFFNISQESFIKDSPVATFVSFLMLLLPASPAILKHFKAKFHGDLPKNPIHSVLNWKKMNAEMPYGFMFLLGGGLALSKAAGKEYSDLNGKIGMVFGKFIHLPHTVIILLIIVFVVLITNLGSNAAVCTVITPVVMQMAIEININPLWYCVAVGYSCSFAFLLPVGTPGNLVVQSAASIPTRKIIAAGFGPTVISVVISWVAILYWAPVIWPDLLRGELPTWVTSNP